MATTSVPTAAAARAASTTVLSTRSAPTSSTPSTAKDVVAALPSRLPSARSVAAASASLSARTSATGVVGCIAALRGLALRVAATATEPRPATPSKEPRVPLHLPLPPPPPNRLQQLHKEGGQSPWIDNLTRDWSASGHLQSLVQRGVRGLTSNPTIFEKAIGGGDVYDAQIREIVHRARSNGGEGDVSSAEFAEEAYWELAQTDIAAAAAIMAPLHRDSQGVDGYVSLEVAPSLAYDTEATVALARKLHDSLDLPNLMVKIPATKDGLPAIRRMIADGRSINVTLIFSLTRYAEVIDAYISGLEELAASPSCTPDKLAAVSSVASFFVSRVDTAVDKKLAAVDGSLHADAEWLKGQAAVAQAVLAYDLFLEKFSGPRWEALAAKGAKVQRPLWASTGVKNPSYPDTLYVDSLIGPNTVNTMPDNTLLAFADHGKVARTIDADVGNAHRVLERVEALGISMEQVAQELEDAGVKSFADSFDSLIGTMRRKLIAMAAPA